MVGYINICQPSHMGTIVLEVETVILDIDDTLIPSSDIEEEALSKSYEVVKDMTSLSFEDFVGKMRGIRRSFEDERQCFYTPEHFLIFLTNNISRNEMLAMKMYVSYTDENINRIRLCDGTSEFLSYLRKNLYNMIVVSKGVRWNQYEKLVRTEISDYFQDWYIDNDETKTLKLTKAMKEYDLDPSKTVYIGDNPDVDIPSAKEVGLISIRLRQGRRSKQDSEIPPDYEFDNLSNLHDFFKNSVTGPSPQPL